MFPFSRDGYDYQCDGKIRQQGRRSFVRFHCEEKEILLGAAKKYGVFIPVPEGEWIVVSQMTSSTLNLERALATPRFKHLDVKFREYPGCERGRDPRNKKRFIQMGTSENRGPDDGSIMDLFHFLQRSAE